jgi:hypothetical protein
MMDGSFGADPFASSAFAVPARWAADPDVAGMLAGSRLDLIYTVEIRIRNTADNHFETLRFANSMWATEPDDFPPSAPFDGRLESYNYRRDIAGNERFCGMATSDGSLVFGSTDNAYASVLDGFVVGWEATVRVGRKSDPLVLHHVLLKGLALDWDDDGDSVSVTLDDQSEKLNVPIQPTMYAGTGWSEGGADLAGKRKPRVYGRLFGVQPPLVDPAYLTYQLTDGPATMIANFFDRGVPLIPDADYTTYNQLAGASIPAGRFATNLSRGFIRLGASPAGTVFGNIRVNDSATHGSIIKEIIDDATDVSAGDIDAPAFAALDVAQPWRLGYLVSSEEAETAEVAIGRLVTGIGGWAGWGRDGKFSVGIVRSPSGSPLARFSHLDGGLIDVRREKLPDGIWPPPWRVRVSYEQVWTPFTDFAGSVTDTLRSFAAQPYRLATAESASALADNPRAQDWDVIEGWVDEFVTTDSLAAAQAEANRLLALYNAGFHLYRVTGSRRWLQFNLGNEVNVTWPNYGLTAGRNVIIVSIEDKVDLRDGGDVDSVEALVFG